MVLHNENWRLHARHYSQEDMCIIGKEEEEGYYFLSLKIAFIRNPL